MLDDVFTTADLYAAIKTIRIPSTFFLDRYFVAPPKFSTQEHIVFDEVLEGLPVMAPFVSPAVAAKSQERSGYQAKSFRPAYVKPKHAIKPRDFIQRLPGEALMGELSPQQRRDQTVLYLLGLQKRQILARLEWMAAQAVINGTVKVEGEDYPAQVVDFGRDKDNSIIISAANDRWSNTDADIISQLESWSGKILSKTGYGGADLIMSPETWAAFRKNKSVLEQADLRRGVTNIPTLDPQVAQEGAIFKGTYGEYSIYVYAGRFREQDGTISRGLEAGEVVMVAAPSEGGTGGIYGVRAFGAIQDADSLQAIDIFPKTWINQDPSSEMLMSQSAPLMIPGRPNASLKAKVL